MSLFTVFTLFLTACSSGGQVMDGEKTEMKLKIGDAEVPIKVMWT